MAWALDLLRNPLRVSAIGLISYLWYTVVFGQCFFSFFKFLLTLCKFHTLHPDPLISLPSCFCHCPCCTPPPPPKNKIQK